MTTALTTPDQMLFFQLARLRTALGIEIRTGMKLSQGSTLAYLRRTNVVLTDPETGEETERNLAGGKATKRGAYVALNAIIVDIFGADRDRPLDKKAGA